MPVIGIVGGVASGKSTVAAELARLGAGVLDADRAGHAVLADPEVIAAVRARWGDSILNERGDVERHAVARIVFAAGAAEERRFLERLTHPRIARLLEQEAQRQQADAAVPAVVLDAPLLVEAGWDALCDWIVFVDAAEELRRRRAAGRGWSAEQFAQREASQADLADKRSRADLVLENSGSEEDLRQIVAALWQRIVAPGR